MFEVTDRMVLHAPELVRLDRDGLSVFVDPEMPNWIGTDEPGARILGLVNGKRSFGEIVRDYAAWYKVDGAKAWLHVHEFIQQALRHQVVLIQPRETKPFEGRARYLEPTKLREFWIHTNNSCNLTCTHCLVSSHPGGDPGISTDQLKKVIDETGKLGVYRYYFTGGEPFARGDIFDLIEYVTKKHGAELIVLTNATLFAGERLDLLKKQDRDRLKLQVSLDGSTPEVNDPIRGEGTFFRIVEGLKTLSEIGFETSLTAVVTQDNLHDLLSLPEFAAKHGAKSIHLMWLHRRGRIMEGNGTGTQPRFPTAKELLDLSRRVKQDAGRLEILYDNDESIKLRVNGRPGIKYDLGNACWDSLCLYSDGVLYPSAAFAGHPGLALGDAKKHSIRDLWLGSPLAQKFRESSLINKAGVQGDAWRYFTGGGDIEHSYFYSETKSGIGTILGEDPYYELYREVIQDVMFELTETKRVAFNGRTGYAVPVIHHAMGEGAIVCGTEEVLLGEQNVSTLHSNCVLSFDVERPHRMVQEFYGIAAEIPQAELCCPIRLEPEEISHIPEEVLQRFYGCGSPVTLGGLGPGEVMVDLGSGSGIDCFIAAKKVGPDGKVIGIDMTDPMLAVANRNLTPVAQNLGFDVVEFRKGYLERIPVEDASVDLITSNCVINLSPDKRAVFSEMWRILKDHGRIAISDIVSDQTPPPHIKANHHLWGECIAGALTQEEFLSELERAGFYGLEVLKKTFWKEIEGFNFYSVTVRAYKYEKKEGCVYIGQKAVYRGPLKAVVDEEGHLFPRDVAIEVCTDTAAKLSRAPYVGSFMIVEPDAKAVELQEAASGSVEENCGPGCC